MEKASRSVHMKRIRSELIHGRDLASRLRSHIKNSSSSQESIRLFLEEIVNSCNLSINLLTLPGLPNYQPFLKMPPGSSTERYVKDKSLREDADCALGAQSYKNKSKKRKCPKRVTQVTLPEGAGLETALEDGHSWRKYGQKDILGSKYPRGYYKCGHKTTKGCLARKHVQRTDDHGPPIFNITYCGVHTCSQIQQQVSNSQLSSSPEPLPSIPKHDIAFSDTMCIEHVVSQTIPYISNQFNHMDIMFLNYSMSFYVGYNHPTFPTTITWFADNVEVPSSIMSTADSFAEVVSWDDSIFEYYDRMDLLPPNVEKLW